jgi:hypothetical protein
MISRRWKLHVSLIGVAMLVSFSPLGFSAERGVAASSAHCETCCPENLTTCLICGTKSCIRSDNYYEAKIGGPCSGQLSPNPRG